VDNGLIFESEQIQPFFSVGIVATSKLQTSSRHSGPAY